MYTTTHQIPMCHKYPLTGRLLPQYQQPDIILNEFFNLSVRTKTIKNTISPIKNHKPAHENSARQIPKHIRLLSEKKGNRKNCCAQANARLYCE